MVRPKKVLVTGAQGLLGAEVTRLLSQDSSYIVKGTTHSELDLTSGKEVAMWIEKMHPDFVINCAALSNVDTCEEHPEETLKVNVEGVKNLCLPLEETGGKLIQISTDYVFDGKKTTPYIETDCVNPLNIYAESKIKSEECAKRFLPESLIVRVQWLYGEYGKNFASQMIYDITYKNISTQYRLIEDRVGTPNDVKNVAQGIKVLLEKDIKGIVHLSCEGECSWVEFGKTIFAMNHIENFSQYIRVLKEVEAQRVAKRPPYSKLSSVRLQSELDFKMPFWEESLQRTILNLKKNL
ncbi:MAG: dTDP-4-dehydrorhamnose reductase [Deltaproteobacteria bacterium]|nr:dTDP-4-dehydrorhamnose reductase [Deltaproteobacteria bacterium]MBI3018195.1 dTDP-4-dehydrorhamnose reductase [Deltaproteobacteria bacterium]